MWTIARLTFREMLNKRVVGLGLVLTVVYLALFGVGLYYAGQDMSGVPDPLRLGVAAQMLSIGLYFSGMMVAGLSIFSAVGAISTEIESGVMQAIVAKPVSRRDIFLGKLAGYGLVLLLYSLLVYFAINLLIESLLNFQADYLGYGLFLFCLQPFILLAITLWGSSFLSTLGNGITMFMLYILSVIGGMVEQIGHLISNASLTAIGVISSLLLPVDSMYRLVNFSLIYGSSASTPVMTFDPFSTQMPPSVWMLVYVGVYFLFFTGLGIRVFSRRDI